MPTTLAAAALALALGYLLGRVRPWARYTAWAGHQAHRGRWWVATRPRRALVRLSMALTAPAYTWHVWRHRNDPPPPRSAPVRVRKLTNAPTAANAPYPNDPAPKGGQR